MSFNNVLEQVKEPAISAAVWATTARISSAASGPVTPEMRRVLKEVWRSKFARHVSTPPLHVYSSQPAPPEPSAIWKYSMRTTAPGG